MELSGKDGIAATKQKNDDEVADLFAK